jgi:ATP-dependent DNA ligase
MARTPSTLSPSRLAAMEARPVATLPEGPEWQYEPKWDGFRCLAFRDGDVIDLRSKAGEPLGRYFPEVVAALRAVGARRFVLDGEITVAVDGRLSFDDLLQRIHPAESRVRRLAEEHPARLVVFDLLLDERGTVLAGKPLSERRPRLERFAARFLRGAVFELSPATPDPAAARRWLDDPGGAFDGLIAKRLDRPYAAGERTAMQKYKPRRTADCVVGGFRYAARERIVGSLLLGLHDSAGRLHHVGYTSSLGAAERRSLTPRLEKLVRPPGFTGRAPGGPSRWSSARSSEWQPLAPKLVVEVEYDHVSGGRFRHGTRFVRWRPDKAARQCRMEQIERPAPAGKAPARRQAVTPRRPA